MTIQRIERGSRMSQAVVHNETVYLAGQVAVDPSSNVAQQTRQILANIDSLLESVGSDKSRILTATIWLADIGKVAEMNSVWDKWIDPENPPARACVQAAMVKPDYKVEIMVTAAL